MHEIQAIRLDDKVYPIEDVHHLAMQIGMDLETDKRDYIAFLKDTLNTVLPYGWKKERCPYGGV